MFSTLLKKALTLGAAVSLVSGVAVAGATLPEELPEQAQAGLDNANLGAAADVERGQGQPEITENEGRSEDVRTVIDAWLADPSDFGQSQKDNRSDFGRAVAEAASAGAAGGQGVGGQGVNGPETAESAGKPDGVGTQSDDAAGNAAEHRQDGDRRPSNDNDE